MYIQFMFGGIVVWNIMKLLRMLTMGRDNEKWMGGWLAIHLENLLLTHVLVIIFKVDFLLKPERFSRRANPRGATLTQ